VIGVPLDVMTETDEEDLLARYAAGDRGAARALTVRLTPAVFAHATRLLGDRAEAEDVTQEAFLKLWRIAPDWRRGEARIGTWLYRVTANLCIDRLRKRRTGPLDEAHEPEDDAPSVERQLTDADRATALQDALDALPERQRQAVVLRHLDGLGNPEIAAIMDISPRAVESLTARGKRALAEMLGARREELGYAEEG
jgi:RNA polymerase sigma-70 factor (ECF subfamily)